MFDFSKVRKPADLKDCTLNDIKQYCIENGKADWLKETAAALIKEYENNKSPKKRIPSFSVLRSRFGKEVLKLRSGKKRTFLDDLDTLIEELEENKK